MTPEEAMKKIETELKIQGKSEKTMKMYTYFNLGLLKHAKKLPEDITEDDVKSYLAYLISDRKCDTNTLALARSALAYFYTEMLKSNVMRNIKTPKKERKIPEVLSKTEIKKLIDASPDLRSKLFIEFMYSAGLRVGECASLKWKDLDIEEKIGMLKRGKGRKDRLFILSEKLMEDIKKYESKEKGEEIYIFSEDKKPISTRTIQRAVKTAAKLAGIKKIVYPHLLRHSFATHLIESGVDIRVIQELLAHSNLQTTQFYTHISSKMIKSVKSPLDTL